jgi:ribosomal protein S18 acetylase RimI-like enzyme
MDDVTWRAALPSDAAGLAELFQAIAHTVPVGLETEPAEVASRLSRPGLDLEQDTLVGVDATGAVLAYAETADMGVGQGRFRIRLTNAIHPDLGDEAVRRTHDWLTNRARHLHQQRRPDLPGALGARCAATDHTRMALLTESGFEVVGWHQDLIRPVNEPLPTPPAPHGIEVVPYHSRYQEATRVAHNDAYADNPSALLPDAPAWPQHAVGLANFLPDASFLALADTADGPDIAAFLFSLEHRDVTGAREGALHCLGTRKPWRRRGLATILISRALAVFRQTGYAQARLQVDSSNTDAVSLYATLGFTDSGRGYAMLQAPIR